MNQDIIAQVAYNEFSPKLSPSEDKEVTHTTFKKQIVTDSNGQGGDQSFKSSKLSPEEKVGSSSTPFASDEKHPSTQFLDNGKSSSFKGKSPTQNKTDKIKSAEIQKSGAMKPMTQEQAAKK